jgi:GNAT superfamily N-acetyltransferase
MRFEWRSRVADRLFLYSAGIFELFSTKVMRATNLAMITAPEISIILDELPPEVAWRRPDSIVVDNSHWFQVITPSSALVPLNGIYRSIIDSDGADSVIESAIQNFAKYKCSFRWIVTGSTRPTDLSNRLERHGFKRDHEALGLAASTTDLLSLAVAANVVSLTEDKPDEWVDAAVAGWGSPETYRASLCEDVLRVVREGSEMLQYFAAVVDEKVVGTGALRICSRSGHLLGSSVRPEYRGRGVYKSLVVSRARVAHDLGLQLVTTHGIQNTSAPILKRIGFREYSKATQYSFGV